MTRVTVAFVIAAALVVAAFLFVRDAVAPGGSPGAHAADAARRDATAAGSEDRAVPARGAASATVAGAPGQPRGPVVRGHVVDRAGVPVNHAAVRLELKSPDEGTNYATADSFDIRVAVEADGTFCVSVPHHAQFTVTAEAKGFAIAAKDVVSSGDEVDLVLDAPVRLTGSVVHLGTRQPLERAKIEVWVPACPHAVRTCVTEAGGAYVFDDLPPVEVKLETRLEGFVSNSGQLDLARAAAFEAHEIALDPGLAVGGQIIAAESGAPIEGARVGTWDHRDACVTDSRGAFRISGLIPGTHGLHAHANGRHEGSAQVVVSETQAPDDLVVPMYTARQFSGIVVDEVGRPLAGARVQAGGGGPFVTAADGHFVVTHGYWFDADNDDLRVASNSVSASLDGYTQVSEATGEDAEPMTLRLLPADVTISGRVQDQGGHPVEGARVILGAEPRGRVAGTDEQGRFAFDRCVRAGTYQLWALAPGFCAAELELARAASDAPTPVEADVTLSPVAFVRVTGTVADDTGAPLAGARVEIVSWLKSAIATGQTMEDGRFEVIGKLPGTSGPAGVKASAAGFSNAEYGIDVSAPLSQFAFTLVRLGRLRGRVVDAGTGEAVVGATIELRDELERTVWGFFGRTAETADFAFDCPPGSFELAVSAPQYLEVRHRIDVSARVTLDAGTIELRHGGAIEGVIRPASGPSRMLAIVLASSGRSSYRRAGSTDSAGWFHLDGLTPGAWEVFGVDETSPYWFPDQGRPVGLCSFGTVEVGDRSVGRIDGRMAPAPTLTVSSGDRSDSGEAAAFSVQGPDSEIPKSEQDPAPWFHLTIRSIEGLPLVSSSAGFSPEFSGWWQGARFEAAIGTLPAGRYRVSLASEGRGAVEAVVELAAAENRRLVLALPPGVQAPAPGK